MSPEQILADAAELYSRRNADYGASYKTFGRIVDAIFPDGLPASTQDDYNRLAIFLTMLGKMHRYALNFKTGHKDSMRDVSVYAAMLLELDGEKH